MGIFILKFLTISSIFSFMEPNKSENKTSDPKRHTIHTKKLDEYLKRTDISKTTKTLSDVDSDTFIKRKLLEEPVRNYRQAGLDFWSLSNFLKI